MPAHPLRRHLAAVVGGALGVGGVTVATGVPAHAENIGFCPRTNSQPVLTLSSQGVAVQLA